MILPRWPNVQKEPQEQTLATVWWSQWMLSLLEITQASSILYPRDPKCMSLSCPQRSASFPSLISPILYRGLLESPSNFHISEALTMSWTEPSEHSAKHTFVSPSLCTALPWILNGLPENMGAPQTETRWGTLWGELLSLSASLPHLLTTVFQGLLTVTRECVHLHLHPSTHRAAAAESRRGSTYL